MVHAMTHSLLGSTTTISRCIGRWSSPLVAIVIAILLQSANPVSVRAQDWCACPNPVALKTLNICIDNVTYNVTVHGCNIIRTAAPLLAGICNNLDQNQYTIITKVCFNGPKPLVIDARKTFSAILCAMSPATPDSAWGGFLPPVVGSIWCWAVMTPKCVEINQATGCIQSCGTTCCVFQMQWTRTATGADYLFRCTRVFDGICNQAPCEGIDCPDRLSCCTAN